MIERLPLEGQLCTGKWLLFLLPWWCKSVTIFGNAESAYEDRHQYVQCYTVSVARQNRLLSEGIHAGAEYASFILVCILYIFCIFAPFAAVLLIRDVYPGSRFFSIPDPT